MKLKYSSPEVLWEKTQELLEYKKRKDELIKKC